MTRYEDRPDQIVYKTIKMSHLPGLIRATMMFTPLLSLILGSLVGDPKDISYSARSESGITMQALPTKDGALNGVVLFKPDDERVLSAKTGVEAKEMFSKHLPMFDECFTDDALEKFAQKNLSRFAKFTVEFPFDMILVEQLTTSFQQYCGKKLHYGTSAVVLGDAIHSVKPFFGNILGHM